MGPSYDVFCSHAHVDAEAVGRLVGALEAAGLAVYVDTQEIDDFSGITQSIEQGLGRSKALVAYYSRSYPTRRACQWELTAAFLAAQRHGDARRRVLVVNPEGTPDHIEPIELRDALYRIAPVAGDEEELAALARSVAEHVAGIQGWLGDVTAPVLPMWHPQQRTGSARFVGRLREMWELHSALQASGLGMITGAVTAVAQLRGLGGVGKSLLAEEYALRFGAAYPGGVFWLRGFGDGEGSLDVGQREAERDRQLRSFATGVGIDVAGLGSDEVRSRLGRWMESLGLPCLWVVDDLASELGGDLGWWLAPHPSAKTLITTRSREYDALGGRVDLGELPALDGLELLTKRRQPQGENETIAANEIAAELGYHPLALDVAGAGLRSQAATSFLEALREPSEDWLERLASDLRDALPTGHERSIARTVSRSIDRLGEEGRDFLRLASMLAAAPLPAQLIADVFAQVDGLDPLAAIARQVAAIEQVQALSLAEGAGELAWRVHALVSRTVKFTDPAPARRERLRLATLDVLTRELREIDGPGQHGPLEPVMPHARELVLSGSGEAELPLRRLVAVSDYSRGDYRSAAILWRRQHDLLRQTLGEEHLDTLTTLGRLATSLVGLGDLAGARPLQQKVLDALRRVGGESDPETLIAMNNLAAILRLQGDMPGARSLQEAVLEARLRVLGPGHADTIAALSNLAGTVRAQGDLVSGGALQKLALEGSRGLLGEEHPQTLTVLNNLAETLRAQNHLDEARRLHEQALDGRRRALGEEHPDTINSLNNLALAVAAQRDLPKARELTEQALELGQRVLGEQHPQTLASLMNLAGLLHDQGDLAGARLLEEQSLTELRRALGREHPQTLTAMLNLAGTLRAQGDLAAALPLQEQAVEARRRVLGEHHPHARAAADSLAEMLREYENLGGEDAPDPAKRSHTP